MTNQIVHHTLKNVNKFCPDCEHVLEILPVKNQIKESSPLYCCDNCGWQGWESSETGKMVFFEDVDYWVREDGTVMYFEFGLFNEDE